MLLPGGVAVALVLALRGSLGHSLTADARAFDVLRVLMALAPLQALDMLVFAVFAKPVVRILAPVRARPGAAARRRGRARCHGRRRAVPHAGVRGGGAGRRCHLLGLLGQLGILARAGLGSLVVPIREVLAFSLPMPLTNVVAGKGTELAGSDPRPLPPGIGRRRFRAVESLTLARRCISRCARSATT